MKTLKRILPLLLAFLLIISVCPLPSFSDVIYQEDFEGSTDLTNWSITSSIHSNSALYGLQVTQDITGNQLLGSSASPNAAGLFNYAEKVQLTLNTQPGSYSMLFDLYAINTWDGVGTGCCGPDYFDFSINNVNRLSVTPNDIDESIYEGKRGINPLFTYNNNNVWANIYTFKIDFTLSGGPLAFEFWGHPDQSGQDYSGTGYPDEPWALDNVKVSRISVSVPEPATMLLLGFGLMGLAGIRRKFK